MIFIFVPQILIFLFFLYLLQYNIFLCLLFTPLLYIIGTLLLVWYREFSNVHTILGYIPSLTICELSIRNSLLFVKNQILRIKRINTIYMVIKVKLLIYILNFGVNFIPNKKENEFEMKLQQDYLKILHKNKNLKNNELKT